MKFIHTADWHLGKVLGEFSLLEDQIFAMNGLLELLRREGADALVIAGDVYDRSVPPAAAVTASALLELARYVPEMEKLYYKTAEKILRSLASDRYLIPAGKKNGFLIDHSVGSKPSKSQVDVPIIYGDYYFLEALLRLKNYKSHK